MSCAKAVVLAWGLKDGTGVVLGWTHARKINFKRGALSGLALHFDMAIALFDDSKTGRQAPTGAFAARLGGVERFKGKHQAPGTNIQAPKQGFLAWKLMQEETLVVPHKVHNKPLPQSVS